jgi:hypothetical protein
MITRQQPSSFLERHFFSLCDLCLFPLSFLFAEVSRRGMSVCWRTCVKCSSRGYFRSHVYKKLEMWKHCQLLDCKSGWAFGDFTRLIFCSWVVFMYENGHRTCRFEIPLNYVIIGSYLTDNTLYSFRTRSS